MSPSDQTVTTRRLPPPVDTTVAEHVANELHGHRYGIDWIYHDDRLGYLPAKPVRMLESAQGEAVACFRLLRMAADGNWNPHGPWVTGNPPAELVDDIAEKSAEPSKWKLEYAYTHTAERADVPARIVARGVFDELVSVMGSDSGVCFRAQPEDYERALDAVAVMIRAGYFACEVEDLDGDYWQMAAGEHTERPERFNRAPEAFAVVDAVLEDIFDRPLEPEADSRPAVGVDEKIDDLAMHLACEHGSTDEAGTGYTFSMEQFDDFIHAFVPALAQHGLRGSKVAGYIEHIEALETDRARLRETLAVYEATAKGADGVWFYQGDGCDFPASLTCPVVMRAPQFRELVKAAATEQAIQKAAASLPEGYVIHLYVEQDSAYIDLTDPDDDPVGIDTEDRDLAEQMAEATEKAAMHYGERTQE